MYVVIIGFDWILFLVLNAAFSNISAISCLPVLVVEEAGVPARTTDHRQTNGKLYHLQLRVECTLLAINKAGPAPTPY